MEPLPQCLRRRLSSSCLTAAPNTPFIGGTSGSNPASSSGESSELLSCDDALAHPAQPSPQWANGEREGDGVAQAGGGYSGYCGSSSVISNQGALLRTKT